MEEKKDHQRHNSLWAVFDFRSIGKFVFGRSNNSQNNNVSGFTLIELVVVVGILSILAVASMIILDPLAQFQKANDTKKKSDFSQIQKALEAYYQDFGKYPLSSTAAPLYRITVPGSPTSVTINWGSPWRPYMNLLPKDPTISKNYVYYSSGQSYWLYASLDRGSKDPQACAGGQCSAPLGSGIDMTSACGGVCNFGVSSPNVSP